MNRLNLEIKNPGPILKKLEKFAGENKSQQGVYLRLPGQHDFENPLNLETGKNILGMSQSILPEILHVFGIRSATLFSPQDLSLLGALGNELLGKDNQNSTDYMQDTRLIIGLSSLFKAAGTVAFDDWQNFAGASKIWTELLIKVIEPLGRDDFEFVFYLGDAARMPSFEVDQALDMMARFAKNGRVVLALDEAEALSLWRVVNGVGFEVELGKQTVVDLKKKYFSIFKTIEVADLLVYSTDSALLLSVKEQFVLVRKLVSTKVEIGSNARENFILGFCSGLHQKMDMAESIALGLVIFGACGSYNTLPEETNIQTYINEWIADLEKPESMNLYQ
jgi:hypothetical protein